MSIAIGNLCYGYYHVTVATFLEGNNKCDGDKVNGFDGISGYAYGRLATFYTPAIYKCVQDQLRTWQQGQPIAYSYNVLIGAHTPPGDGSNLTEFFWTGTSSSSDGCRIFTNPPVSTGQVGLQTGSGTYYLNVLAVDPNNAFQFWTYDENDVGSFALYYLCEFGKPGQFGNK